MTKNCSLKTTGHFRAPFLSLSLQTQRWLNDVRVLLERKQMENYLCAKRPEIQHTHTSSHCDGRGLTTRGSVRRCRSGLEPTNSRNYCGVHMILQSVPTVPFPTEDKSQMLVGVSGSFDLCDIWLEFHTVEAGGCKYTQRSEWKL